MILQPSEPARASATGFALFALGFRPLYLLAGAYAALSVPLWGLQYAGWLPGAGAAWHAHEMLFGYAFAVIAGFLLTAVRAWTKRPTPSGAALAAIAALWLAARVAAPFSLQVAAVLDIAFALSVALGIGRPILATRNRNWFFILLVLALGAASVVFTLFPRQALAIGLDLVLFIIAVMAGRVIPPFTNNAIAGAGARRHPRLEYAALASVLALIALDAMGLEIVAAFAALAAALLHAWRLWLWAPLATRGRPILWILHVSYAWVVVHLALRGLAGFGLAPAVLATHAFTIGAIGGLTLGMMTRTTRGHTARPLTVGRAEVWAYALVQASAIARVVLPLLEPSLYRTSVILSAALWGAAFVTFVLVYFPILAKPRLDGMPG